MPLHLSCHGRSWVSKENKTFRIKSVAALSIVLLVGLLVFGTQIGLVTTDIKKFGPRQLLDVVTAKSHFHLIVPASASNVNLCKNLLSGAVLNYPPAVLAGWNATGKFDASASHLAKILTIQRYLESLSAEIDDDLILIVDGYDIWFQLRPDVLIQRYFNINKAVNNRLIAEYGRDLVEKHDIRQTIIFGPDKLCWPVDYRRPACWAAPDPDTIPKYAFGPSTDDGVMQHMRPRWLNSGTIIGPLRDVRLMIDATAQKIYTEYNTEFENRDSDQYYFANLYGEQEYARHLLRPKGSHPAEEPLAAKPGSDLPSKVVKRSLEDKPNLALGEIDVPVFEPGQRTEFHIGIDYESSMFQTSAGYAPYIAWMTYKRKNDLIERPKGETATFIHQNDVPDDILSSPPPLSALQAPNMSQGNGSSDTLLKLSWADMPLGTNVITKQIFPIFHLTGEKSLRELWWPTMWFYPYGENLLHASTELPRRSYTVTADGREWWAAERKGDDEHPRGKKGGAWSDTGEWLPWEELCSSHEKLLFGQQD